MVWPQENKHWSQWGCVSWVYLFSLLSHLQATSIPLGFLVYKQEANTLPHRVVVSIRKWIFIQTLHPVGMLSMMYMHTKSLQSCLTLCDPMDCVAHQAPLSMGFSREEYWSGLQCPPPGGLPDPRIKPMSPVSPTLAGGFFTIHATWEAPYQW